MRSSYKFVIGALIAASSLSACSDSKSYAELLTEERKSANYYLSGCRVVDEIPADEKFETGPDAPYYRMDDDGNVYMQVVNPGTVDNKVEAGQQIYFRFMRYNLNSFHLSGCATIDEAVADGAVTPEGNAFNLAYGATWFRYGDFSSTTTARYGSAMQLPLAYLGIDCEVNMVVKSQLGFTDEIANVVPFLYNVRYFPAISN